MDGLARNVTRSLQSRLSFWLSLFVLAVGTLAGALSFWLAFDEAHELQDEQLRQIARLAVAERLSPERAASALGADADREAQVHIIRIGSLPQDDAIAPFVRSHVADGMQTLKIRDRSWRVYVLSRSPETRIAAAQLTRVRDEAAINSALRTLLPILGLIPLLLILIHVVVRSALSPVARMARMLDGRSEENLSPLPAADVPREIHPFLSAINRLFTRLSRALEHQRRFIADAAHELRTPLTALSLQAQNLENANSLEEVRHRLEPLKQGLERARQLLEQLLSLARQSATSLVAAQPLLLDLVARRVFEELLPLADEKGIDLGMDRVEPVRVSGDEFALHALLRNVVDNAVQYTPAGGRVDLRVFMEGGHAVVEVEDTGPGIPEKELEQVFEPFYRVAESGGSGSGLGLSIVKSIADKYGLNISLRNADPKAGLRFRCEISSFGT
jgi:two-component system OmpR family sensor kinase